MNYVNCSHSPKATTSARQGNPNQSSYQSFLDRNSQPEYSFQHSCQIQSIVECAVSNLLKSLDFKKLVKHAVQAPLKEPLQLTKNISRSGGNTEELEIKRSLCRKMENLDIEKDLSKNASPMILNEIRF